MKTKQMIKRAREFAKPFRVTNGRDFHLKDVDPDDTLGLSEKEDKWFTRVVVAAAVIETLADLDLAYPDVGEDKLKELAAAKTKLTKK